ncbi:hypothetical protein HMPREF1870_02644 [Bacteroidales bacterium KA00344]|nr:hypothetical protein HMPREF1870_02644 [Bacteroidales bacterium KA00344]
MSFANISFFMLKCKGYWLFFLLKNFYYGDLTNFMRYPFLSL